MHILVVEDDLEMLDLLRIGFEDVGYPVTLARSAEEAFGRLGGTRFDLVLLDLQLPGRDGLEVLGALRRNQDPIPVIIMTGGRTGVESRVEGLDLGADDYLVKPFAFSELLARVRAVMRRAAGGDALTLRVGDLEMDLTSRRVTRGGREVELTGREFALLEHLVRHAGRLVSRECIATDVWKESSRATSLDNVIDVHISHLRQKIDEGFSTPLIRTVRGEGFTLGESP